MIKYTDLDFLGVIVKRTYDDIETPNETALTLIVSASLMPLITHSNITGRTFFIGTLKTVGSN